MALRGLFRRSAHAFIQLPRVKQLELKSGSRMGVYNTPQLRNARVTGVKPTKERIAQLRTAFNADDGPNYQFREKVRREAPTTDLQAIGLTDDQIREFRANGHLPRGYAVHHRIPLAGGGTNDLDNLILIKNDPDHDLITARQNSVLQRIKGGQPLEVEGPVMPPVIYTWPQPGSHAHRRR